MSIMQLVQPAQAATRSWLINGYDFLAPKKHVLGLLVAAGKGSGKSYGLGKDLLTRYYRQGIPQVIIETTGGMVDPFLDQLQRDAACLPPEQRAAYLSRVIYQDMAGSDGWVVSKPLYYQLHSSETLYTIANRPIELWLLLDEKLHDAPIQGAAALRKVGIPMGQLLWACGMQITEGRWLLDFPEQWEELGLFDLALQRYGAEIEDAVTFFRKIYRGKGRGGWSNTEAQRNTAVLQGRLDLFTDWKMRAMFGQRVPWNLDAVAQHGITWIRDYRHVRDPYQRRFHLNYDLKYLMEWTGYRDLRAREIQFVFEELSEYTRADVDSNTELASMLSYLVHVEARNKGIMPTFVIQSLSMLSPTMQRAMLSCGNLVIGRQDFESALLVARELLPYEKPIPKRYEPIFMGSPDGPMQIGERQLDHTLEESMYLKANLFTRLPGWANWVRSPGAEDRVAAPLGEFPLLPMRVSRGVGQWPNPDTIARFRSKLAPRVTQPMDRVVEELAQRRDPPLQVVINSAILPEEEPIYDPAGYAYPT